MCEGVKVMFYLIRHGETDYSERNTKIYQGFGVNLSKLSKTGINQIKETSKDDRLKDADIIISSPYTRALQTAAILSKELDIDIIIETDLFEWLANKKFIYEDDKTAEKSYEEYENNRGEYPNGKEMVWENALSIRKRVLEVLNKYSSYKKVIVTCHGMMIQATTGGKHPACGEIIEFEI